MANETLRTGLRKGLGSLFLGATVLQLANRQLFQALVPEKLAAHSIALQGMMAGALGFKPRPRWPPCRVPIPEERVLSPARGLTEAASLEPSGTARSRPRRLERPNRRSG